MSAARDLPARPSLDSLRKQAKKLARDAAAGNAEAIARVHAQLPQATLPLSNRDAQLVIAREYGFAGWPDLTAEVQNAWAAGSSGPSRRPRSRFTTRTMSGCARCWPNSPRWSRGATRVARRCSTPPHPTRWTARTRSVSASIPAGRRRDAHRRRRERRAQDVGARDRDGREQECCTCSRERTRCRGRCPFSPRSATMRRFARGSTNWGSGTTRRPDERIVIDHALMSACRFKHAALRCGSSSARSRSIRIWVVASIAGRAGRHSSSSSSSIRPPGHRGTRDDAVGGVRDSAADERARRQRSARVPPLAGGRTVGAPASVRHVQTAMIERACYGRTGNRSSRRCWSTIRRSSVPSLHRRRRPSSARSIRKCAPHSQC